MDEWIVSVIKAMYEDPTTTVRVNGRESKAFSVRVGVHQGSVLSPLLFIIVLEALSREFREGLPMELVYADDLVLVAETEELLLEKLRKGPSINDVTLFLAIFDPPPCHKLSQISDPPP